MAVTSVDLPRSVWSMKNIEAIDELQVYGAYAREVSDRKPFDPHGWLAAVLNKSIQMVNRTLRLVGLRIGFCFKSTDNRLEHFREVFRETRRVSHV